MLLFLTCKKNRLSEWLPSRLSKKKNFFIAQTVRNLRADCQRLFLHHRRTGNQGHGSVVGSMDFMSTWLAAKNSSNKQVKNVTCLSMSSKSNDPAQLHLCLKMLWLTKKIWFGTGTKFSHKPSWTIFFVSYYCPALPHLVWLLSYRPLPKEHVRRYSSLDPTSKSNGDVNKNGPQVWIKNLNTCIWFQETVYRVDKMMVGQNDFALRKNRITLVITF